MCGEQPCRCRWRRGVHAGRRPTRTSHLKSIYETGCSLYFTVAVPEADDPLAQWQAAKAAASDAMIAAGATITHHHAVGTDHKPWLAREIGAVGVGILRAVKAELDPTGHPQPGGADPVSRPPPTSRVVLVPGQPALRWRRRARARSSRWRGCCATRARPSR